VKAKGKLTLNENGQKLHCNAKRNLKTKDKENGRYCIRQWRMYLYCIVSQLWQFEGREK